jgi:hypothetical protein
MNITIDDISSDVRHLAHLIDLTVEHIHNDLDLTTEQQRKMLGRIESLLWVARDVAEKAERDLQDQAMTLLRSKKEEAR